MEDSFIGIEIDSIKTKTLGLWSSTHQSPRSVLERSTSRAAISFHIHQPAPKPLVLVHTNRLHWYFRTPWSHRLCVCEQTGRHFGRQGTSKGVVRPAEKGRYGSNNFLMFNMMSKWMQGLWCRVVSPSNLWHRGTSSACFVLAWGASSR